MRIPPSPIQLILFVFILILLFTLVQIGLLHIAAEKLGIDFTKALFALFLSLLGSVINLPLFTLPLAPDVTPPPYTGWLLGTTRPQPDRVIVAINLGGAIMPILFSLYLLTRLEMSLLPVLLAISIVSTVSYLLSRPIPGLGIAMPVFIPPMVAALCAFLFAPEHSAPLAYVSGTFGVIIGADLLRLKEIQRIGASVVSIGGAGTFDGIFLTGIVAVLLA
jgi:uncharacterized membrane protein